MEAKKAGSNNQDFISSMLERNKKPSLILYVALLLLYLMTSVYLRVAANSGFQVTLFGMEVPMAIFTGVFSSIANICIIFMVVFFDKLGIITSLILILPQFPTIIVKMLITQELSGIPGLFTNIFTVIAILLLYNRNRQIDAYQAMEISYLKEQQRLSQHLFKQTATALVNSIDAKDTYSHGHSLRVAEYSEKIAVLMGKNREECDHVYYAALLHDVGKIGISDTIINKKGKLTDDEYHVIKQHAIMGDQILSSITEYSYLRIGAHYHHERYDGKGYPEGLKGDRIPEIARIISVADSYDAMTSNRSYRDAIPQQLVREEIVKGCGAQFDPEIARVMLQLIDEDKDYRMKERNIVRDLGGLNLINCNEYRSEISEGINLTACMTKIRMFFVSKEQETSAHKYPSIVLFDSLDEKFHKDEKEVRELLYYEYGVLHLNGTAENVGARKIEVKEYPREKTTPLENGLYEIKAVKVKDHVLIRVDDGTKMMEFTVALPDSSRYAYIGLTGEQCRIFDVVITKSDMPVQPDYIPRIIDEISYINGITGDIPNVQIDGVRTDATEGIPVTDGLSISFHSVSLPTARLVWHCAYIDLFSADDGKVNGRNFHEYALIRMDGENCGKDEPNRVSNSIQINKQDGFEGWEAWKKYNKEGVDCLITFERRDNEIILRTENLGLSITSTTTIMDGTEKIYAAITGDQCAITDIRIKRPELRSF